MIAFESMAHMYTVEYAMEGPGLIDEAEKILKYRNIT